MFMFCARGIYGSGVVTGVWVPVSAWDAAAEATPSGDLRAVAASAPTGQHHACDQGISPLVRCTNHAPMRLLKLTGSAERPGCAAPISTCCDAMGRAAPSRAPHVQPANNGDCRGISPPYESLQPSSNKHSTAQCKLPAIIQYAFNGIWAALCAAPPAPASEKGGGGGGGDQ